jgi:O-methyltransferase involved in polyketide biosynthesis
MGRSPTGNERMKTETGGLAPGLAGVSETMLWSLHHRACEARRPDGVIIDPESVRIESAIDYDFKRHFGNPRGSLAVRAAEIDRALRAWLERHPDGIVVSLGEGLETQVQRVDNGRMRWLSVDLPDAIRLRERFLTPNQRFRHIAASALDPVWMDEVDDSSGVFIVAQGLLMYLAPERVRQLFAAIADRFPGADLLFDAIPRWFSDLTLRGLHQTASYLLPPMPWGIDRDDVEPTLRRWHTRVASVAFLPYQSPRGFGRLLANMASRMPMARHSVPSLVHVKIENAGGLSVGAEKSSGDGFAEQQNQALESNGERRMTALNDDMATALTIGGFLAAATQNARCGGEIAVASSHVIGKRVALGIAASINPLRADRAEFSRMVPEKVEAFTSAGRVMLKQSGQASRQMLRHASDEVMTTARATIEMTACANPAALMDAQSRFARAWFGRATSRWIAMGLQAFEAQSAAMAPIRQTVVANAERLGR